VSEGEATRMTGSCGCGGKSMVMSVGGYDWKDAPIEKVAEWNPQLAYARALRVPLVPWLPTIRATFQDSTTATIGPFSWTAQGSSSDQVRLNTFGVVDRIMFQIDAYEANSGQAFKPQIDFYYGLQSGIEATLIVDGDPKYVPTPDFVPIRMLAAMLNEAWPMGWVLSNTNVCKMQFNVPQLALLTTPPVKVSVTFRMWVPNVGTARGRQFLMLNDRQAYEGLGKLGYDVGNAADYC
jgi:hypothetical protein